MRKFSKKADILILYFLFDQMLCRFLLFPLMEKHMQTYAYHTSVILLRTALVCAVGLLHMKALVHEAESFRMNKRKGLPECIGCVILILLAEMSYLSLFRSSAAAAANQSAVNLIKDENIFRGILESLLYAPLIEEIVFRDVLIDALKEHTGKAAAVLFSCILFGFMHVCTGLQAGVSAGFVLLPLYGACGLILSLCKEQSGSLFYAIASHFLVNLVVMLAV